MAGPASRSVRGARRTHRTRVRAGIAAGVVAVVALAKKAAAPTTTAAAAAQPQASVTATSKVPEITAYQDPVETSQAVTKLSDKTEYGLPRTFLVTDQSHPGWLHVLLPVRPNGSNGWIKASDVTMGTTDYEIRIELGAHKLTLLKLGQPVLDS